MKCVYHLPGDVVLLNVISVGKERHQKSASGDDGEGGGEVAAPETGGQNNQIQIKGLHLFKIWNVFV